MEDKKLEAFKIAETRKPSVTSHKKAEAAPATESLSLGFRRIEGILEQEQPETVRNGLNRLKDRLEALAQSSSSNREKSAAKKAIVAVDRTAELMDFLFKTKDSLVQNLNK